MNRALLVSIAGLAIGGTAVGMIAAPVVRATLSRGGEAKDIEGDFDRALVAHADAVELHARRFNGRSAIHPPFNPNPRKPEPRVYTPPPPRTTRQPEPVKPPPPAPPKYTGPAVIGCDGFAVYFEDELRIKIGGEDEKTGIKVVSADMPWSVRLVQGEWEGDQPLFERAWEEKLQQGAAAFTEKSSGGFTSRNANASASKSRGNESARERFERRRREREAEQSGRSRATADD